MTPWVILQNFLYRMWLLLPVDHPNLDPWVIASKSSPGDFGGFLLIFLLKLPILICDVFSGLVIYKILRLKKIGGERALVFFALWILNPYTTLFAEMDGTVDIVVVLFSLLTVYLYLNGRRGAAAFPLFIATVVKLYSILLLPVVATVSVVRRLWRVFALFLVSSILGVILYSLWISTTGANILQTSLNYTPLTFQFSEILLTPYDSRIGLATVFGLVYLFLVHLFWDRKKLENFEQVCFGFLLFYFAFFNWWPSYLLLLVGFMFIEAGIHLKAGRYMITLLFSAFIFELTVFSLANEYSLFYIDLYFPWMRTASDLLSRLTVDVTVRLVFIPLLRSWYTVLSLYYGTRVLFRNSSLLKTRLAAIDTL
ncbi:hypothetical protein [[Eubacterium] cellulosolvens]